MAEKRIGIIGGSGLYRIEDFEVKAQEKIATPFGEPSEKLDVGVFEGREIVFLPRHGYGHRLIPSEINHRANIWAMKKLGVEWLVSVSAVGSLKKEIEPLDIVMIDQFFDRTKQSRTGTFFGDGIACHIMFAHPVCSELSRVLVDAGRQACPDVTIHETGTYLNMEGPAFSTKAESLIYKSWGMDVIGMTNMNEARLAREAEICYATLALVTDYDCWMESDPDAVVSVEVIIKNINRNIAVARKIIKKAVPMIGGERTCECATALQNAVITSPDRITDEAYNRMKLILGESIRK